MDNCTNRPRNLRAALKPAVATTALLLAGCGLIDVFTTSREIGHILVAPDPFMRTIVAPDTVPLATPFSVTINTFGSSSCTAPDGADVTTAPLLVRITPYDRINTSGPCTADFASRPHPVTIQFAAAGTATIRVIGKVSTTLDSVEQSVQVK